MKSLFYFSPLLKFCYFLRFFPFQLFPSRFFRWISPLLKNQTSLLKPIRILTLLLWSFFYGFTSTSYGLPDRILETPKIVAVEPRLYNPRYDITAQLSLLPLDAFYKGYAAGVSYTQSLSPEWSWEIVNFNFNSKSDTGLAKKLNAISVAPKDMLDHISWFATTSAVYTPIYSKNLLFNESILHGNLSFVLSGGLVSFHSEDTSPLIGGGAIYRIFHSPSYSSKFDLRLYTHLAEGKNSDLVMTFTYGLSFELGDNSSWD
jgi:outer membrane beta-barrel protein